MKLICQRPHDRRHMPRLFSLLVLLLTAACGTAVSTPRPAEVAEPIPPSPTAPLTPSPGSSSFTAPDSRASGQPCRAVSFEAADYTVCEIDLRRYRVGLFW